MNRRNALKSMGTLLAASMVSDTLIAADKKKNENRNDAGIHVRFLGTGAADWNSPNASGELRRYSSILVDGHILVDFTARDREMLRPEHHPDVIFYTHSHWDHFHPESALALGVKQVYLSGTWYDEACVQFSRAAKKLGVKMPELCPLHVGQPVEVDGLRFTPVPGNHATEKRFEQCLLYLIEKGPVRLLYATDTGGLPAMTTRLVGIDSHRKGAPLHGLIMEATMGLGHEEDYRIFTHSSVYDVERTAKVLTQTGRYAPPSGQPVYLTHMAKSLHGTQQELDAQLPEPLKAAYDGLEVVFRAK